jgi:hypothetical protein
VPVLSARDFFREALRFVALAVVAVNLVDLGHSVVDRTIGVMPPVPLGGDIWWPVASMVVFGPIYVVLAWHHRARGADSGGSSVRRWTASVILLATTLILLGSLVAVLNQFLIGGADAVFLVKAAIVAVVAGAIFVAHRQR